MGFFYFVIFCIFKTILRRQYQIIPDDIYWMVYGLIRLILWELIVSM
jgi:hypothetical protein